MATVAELETQLKAALDRIEALEENSATKVELEDAANAPFVGYVTTKYIGDGWTREWQIRPAILIDTDTLIVFAPDDEGGTYTARNVKKNNQNHIPNTWHDQEG